MVFGKRNIFIANTIAIAYKDILEVKSVFFDALKVPSFARANFYLIKQQESGWAKGVYLTALDEVYHACVQRLEFHFNARKRKSPDLTLADIKLPIKEVTGGNETGKFDKESIEELDLAVHYAGQMNKAEPHYSSIEVLSFAEYALWFIRREFQTQAKDLRTKSNKATYRTYLIAEDAPFFKFPQFKTAVRDLILNSAHPENLKKILKPYYDASLEIVSLWNGSVSKLSTTEQGSDEKITTEDFYIQFFGKTLNHSTWNNLERFELYQPTLFSNYQLASFASKIANLLTTDLFGGKNVIAKLTHDDFLIHFINGIHKLLRKDREPSFITEVKEGKRRKPLESSYSSWFSDWLEAGSFISHSEPLKADGKIDLLAFHEDIGSKILEFKGWWNRDKGKIVLQIYKYLTQFESEGFVVIINDTKRSIVEKYKALVTTKESGYQRNTWLPSKYGPTAFEYYKSQHKLGPSVKDIYHFIISVH